ncbi:dihydrofolate reductase family protein [uncultured Limosilactobacillus sp.]|uniref:dihydrofolate reductase family protein n=1 Tax=uncultured Limosilactobacillus sp. TaxID=2837629 RepID=UPI0025F2A9E6|nr:dihydrofolate reductase family protein [uncultured Limosilactobacillus sp.]
MDKELLGYKSRTIEVVTRQAPVAYMVFLRSMKIPYLVCGTQNLDLKEALVKLKRCFGIQTLAVCGGGIINGAFLKAGLVDQVSLVVAPYVSGDPQRKRAFNTFGQFVDEQFNIQDVKKLSDGGVHLLFKRAETIR